MKPPSKHGLERKFKPWRKGKSAKFETTKKSNASQKNQLRGQKRLLSKLENNQASAESIEGVKQKIAQIEKDIAEYEAKEREKKNAVKYHKVKFYERQKLTRLEKSVKRQLGQLLNDGGDADRAAQLQKQLLCIGLDQLYVAFFPTSMKYMTLFQNGSSDRVVDDEKAQRRRKDVWNKIKEGLLKQLQSTDDSTNNDDEDLVNAKKWINWEAAKKALLTLPEEIYPNCPGSISVAQASKSTTKKDVKKEAAARGPDNRFALTKELDGLFKESTTGDDYQTRLKSAKAESDDSSVSSDSSDSSEDDADPLAGQKSEALTKPSDNKSTRPPSPSSSSSSSSSSDDSSDEESDANNGPPQSETKVQVHTQPDVESESDEDDDEDDFFAAGNASAGDVFAQLQKEQMKKKRQFDEGDTFLLSQQRKADKSKGFATQKQSKKDFHAYQQRQRRQKFG